jgi:hypothetical protein
MMFSTNRLVGAAVYRTRKALNANAAFMSDLKTYEFAPNCLYDGSFHLWHYPGTHEEISRLMVDMSKTIDGSRRKFPCIMNFLPVTETVTNSNGGDVFQIRLNLAICSITDSHWLTQTRERIVFDKVLRPIYVELINQLSRIPYILNGYGTPAHAKHEIYTTGANAGQIHDRYNEHIDAIEISNLILTIDTGLCENYYSQMAEESNKVLTEF